MKENNFAVRIYGILINDAGQVLITDEIFKGKQLIKFPGGGLEYGEGTIECLQREGREEMGLKVEVGEHFYTTDFFLPSIFNNNCQVVCIYYRINVADYNLIKTSQKKFDFPEQKDGAVVFRWVNVKDILSEDFTFENDRRVAKILFEKLMKGEKCEWSKGRKGEWGNGGIV